MSASVRTPFNSKVVLALMLFGAAAFLATLYFIGTGQTGSNTGEANATAPGLNGYAALYEMLGKQGYQVSQSRTHSGLKDEALLVLTPSMQTDANELQKVISARRYIGPTLLILPKWFAFKPPATIKGSKPGWVMLAGATTPDWVEDLKGDLAMKANIAPLPNPR